MKIKYAAIRKAMEKECKGGKYHMRLVKSDGQAVERAVNQGIDSHLEAAFIPERGDKFEWKNGFLACEITQEGMCTLLRRLFEAGCKEDDVAFDLAMDILGTLGWDEEIDDDIEIVSDLDSSDCEGSE